MINKLSITQGAKDNYIDFLLKVLNKEYIMDILISSGKTILMTAAGTGNINFVELCLDMDTKYNYFAKKVSGPVTEKQLKK